MSGFDELIKSAGIEPLSKEWIIARLFYQEGKRAGLLDAAEIALKDESICYSVENIIGCQQGQNIADEIRHRAEELK